MLATNNVYLVDDDYAILDSLRFMLNQYNIFPSIFSDPNSFLNTANLMQPGCAVLDSRIPKISGQEIQKHLSNIQSPLGVIFLTAHGDMNMAVNAFRYGACDFFQKPVDGKLLVESIKKALTISEEKANIQLLEFKLKKLTDREYMIFNNITKGSTNKQIADSLNISLRTVEVHRANLMRKLDINNIAELLQFTHITVK